MLLPPSPLKNYISGSAAESNYTFYEEDLINNITTFLEEEDLIDNRYNILSLLMHI